MVAQTVLTAPFSGIDHKQRVFLARALAYRHEMDEQEADFASLSLSRKDERLAFAFGSSLRLAHSLSTSLPGLLPHTRLAVTGDKLRLTIDPKFTELDGPILDKRLGLTARLLGLKPEIVFRKVKRQGKVKRQSKAKRA
jgi:exopolyphosphatase/guanosine-5'-triphosphate,3'-diphosphate pyrophosphatase